MSPANRTPAPVEFIAEVSSNHGGSLERSLEFIDKAAEIGCTAAKFQLFRIDELFAPEALKAKPDLLNRKRWELPCDFIPSLAKRCEERGIAFICTPFYLDAVDILADYVASYKIASYELLWDELLIRCARTGKPVILSTGMATLDEVEHAVSILRTNSCSEITLLHCTSAYPAVRDDANLAAIDTLRKATQCRLGWSDHTVRASVIQRAVHRWGAEVIEFHLDLDGAGWEFDGGHCWMPRDIGRVIQEIQDAFCADGDGVKVPRASEYTERQWRADPGDGLRPLKTIRDKLNT